jgi:hypothetical protein
MVRAAPVALQRRQQQVAALQRQLQALSPMAVLERGYSLTRTADGRLLRTERWHWHGAELRSVVIDQEPLRLRHHAEQGVEIVTELAGQERGRSPHRAASEVMQSMSIQHPRFPSATVCRV